MVDNNQIKPVPWQRLFYWRLIKSIFFAFLLLLLSLGLGMFGYHYYEKMNWIDSFANAAMILSGMGPLTPLQTNDGKLFAGFYALYSGLAFILVLGLIIGPLFHRFFHKFHLETLEEIKRKK